MSIAEHFQDKIGVPYFRGQDITDFFLENVKPVYIPEEIYNTPLLKRSHFQSGDVLLSIVGTIGNLSLVTESIGKSTGSCKLAIIRPRRINPAYLATFLMSKYGNEQIKRLIRGAVQTGLILEDFNQIFVVIASQEFQKKIGEVITLSLDNNINSRLLYAQAEQLLLSELNLNGWVPNHQLSFVKNYSDTQSAERNDAEYFQPMYEYVVTELSKYKNGCSVFSDLVKVSDRNFTPKDDVVYKYIELSNISTNGNITGFTEEQGKNLPTRARQIVNKGDVVISSIEGSLESIALINDPLNNALCSTGFYVVNSPKLNSETLLIFLKSQAGQLQLKKGCSGTILTAIGKDELMKIIIPEIDKETQENIKDKIDEMYRSREISRTLLDIAKRGVEMAIELDEVQAQKWIEEKLSEID